MDAKTFLVSRQDLRLTRVEPDPQASVPLPAGAVRMRIGLVALTANNITYGAFGDTMHYWDFFPAPVEGFGSIPVWGFADVAESRVEGIAVGERFYGYWPMAEQAVLQPMQVNARGFADGAPHRAALAAIYNQYLRCSADPGYRADAQAHVALLRPLFTTAFLIDDFLADNAFFGAGTVLLSSASSKTGYGTAFCLAQRRGTPGAPRVVGLTSAANLAFTKSLACYDEVLAYDTIESLPLDGRAVYVDFNGGVPLRAAVHAHFGDALAYSCSVGAANWSETGSGKGLPGPKPTLFFAPAQAKKRLADWGGAGFQQRLGAAWSAFMRPVTDPDAPWLVVERGRGLGALEAVYDTLLDGGADPRNGHVVDLGP